MKILSVKFDGYKMFTPTGPMVKLGKNMNLLIGVNGSGKSTILEVLAIVFSEIKNFCDQEITAWQESFDFDIYYQFTTVKLNGTKSSLSFNLSTEQAIIHLYSTTSANTGFKLFANDIEITERGDISAYLPDNLIFYYAGFCSTLEDIVSKRYDKWADKLYKLRSDEKQADFLTDLNKNIIYIKNEYYPLLFVLNYLDSSKIQLPLSNKEVTLIEIKFHLTKPVITSSNDYEKFYNLGGLLGKYLSFLQKESSLSKAKPTEDKDFDSVLTIDYHQVIIDSIKRILQGKRSSKENKYYAFQLICLLFHIKILKEISVEIRDNNGESYNITHLSEGEQQLIVIDAINKILCDKNSVLILDEPDAFLHPKRQREILPYLKNQLQYTDKEGYVQIIATTHSPFVAQSIPIENVQVFTLNPNVIIHPEYPLASYPAIVSDLFYIESEFSKVQEKELELFMEYKRKILNGDDVDKVSFKRLVESLLAKGSEVETIINRELNQLHRLNNNFTF